MWPGDINNYNNVFDLLRDRGYVHLVDPIRLTSAAGYSVELNYYEFDVGRDSRGYLRLQSTPSRKLVTTISKGLLELRYSPLSVVRARDVQGNDRNYIVLPRVYQRLGSGNINKVTYYQGVMYVNAPRNEMYLITTQYAQMLTSKAGRRARIPQLLREWIKDLVLHLGESYVGGGKPKSILKSINLYDINGSDYLRERISSSGAALYYVYMAVANNAYIQGAKTGSGTELRKNVVLALYGVRLFHVPEGKQPGGRVPVLFSTRRDVFRRREQPRLYILNDDKSSPLLQVVRNGGPIYIDGYNNSCNLYGFDSSYGYIFVPIGMTTTSKSGSKNKSPYVPFQDHFEYEDNYVRRFNHLLHSMVSTSEYHRKIDLLDRSKVAHELAELKQHRIGPCTVKFYAPEVKLDVTFTGFTVAPKFSSYVYIYFPLEYRSIIIVKSRALALHLKCTSRYNTVDLWRWVVSISRSFSPCAADAAYARLILLRFYRLFKYLNHIETSYLASKRALRWRRGPYGATLLAISFLSGFIDYISPDGLASIICNSGSLPQSGDRELEWYHYNDYAYLSMLYSLLYAVLNGLVVAYGKEVLGKFVVDVKWGWKSREQSIEYEGTAYIVEFGERGLGYIDAIVRDPNILRKGLQEVVKKLLTPHNYKANIIKVLNSIYSLLGVCREPVDKFIRRLKQAYNSALRVLYAMHPDGTGRKVVRRPLPLDLLREITAILYDSYQRERSGSYVSECGHLLRGMLPSIYGVLGEYCFDGCMDCIHIHPRQLKGVLTQHEQQLFVWRSLAASLAQQLLSAIGESEA